MGPLAARMFNISITLPLILFISFSFFLGFVPAPDQVYSHLCVAIITYPGVKVYATYNAVLLYVIAGNGTGAGLQQQPHGPVTGPAPLGFGLFEVAGTVVLAKLLLLR